MRLPSAYVAAMRKLMMAGGLVAALVIQGVVAHAEMRMTPTAAQPAEESSAKPRSLEDFIKAGKLNGYDASVVGQPDDPVWVLKMTKLGKTTRTYGILQKKWDESDTIDLKLRRSGDGFQLDEVNRNVMVKPPIGDWIKQPSIELPAWVLQGKIAS